MKLALISDLMLRHGIKRVQAYDPSDELPYPWFAVELAGCGYIGTGRTVEDAWKAAAKESIEA